MTVSALPCPVAISGAAQHIVVPFTATKAPNTTTRLVLPAGYVKSYQFGLQSFGISGSSPTLDAKLQTSYDGGITWTDIGSGAAVQITAANHADAGVGPLTAAHGDQLGILLTVGGTAQAAVGTIDTGVANSAIAWSSVVTNGTVDGTMLVKYTLANDVAIAGYTFPKASNTLSVVVTGSGTVGDPAVINVILASGAGTKASVATSLTGTNNDLDFTAKKAGVWANGATGGVTVTYVDPGKPSAALSVVVTGGSIVVNLATGAGTKSTVATSLTGNNNDLDITDQSPVRSDKYTITYADPGLGSCPLSGSFSGAQNTGGDCVITLATDSTGKIISTAAQVAAKIAEVTGGLMTAANHSGNDGTGVVTALTKTSLASAAAQVITTIASAIATAVAALPAAAALVDVANHSANDGTGVVTAMTKQNLASGVDPVTNSTAAAIETLVNADGTAGALVQGAASGGSTDAGKPLVTTANTQALVTGGAVSVAGQLDVFLGYV